MNRSMLRQYTKLVDFLGQALGPDYEITLHDLEDPSKSIVAIANGYISGRTAGEPLTGAALQDVLEKKHQHMDYRINYSGASSEKKVLRSSTLYIKDDTGKLIGLLCINFDDTRYQELSTRLFQLCHPDEFVERNIVIRKDLMDEEENGFPNSVISIADGVIQEVVSEDGVPADRLTQEEKIRIVGILDKRGVFYLKGAVANVAKALHSSPASIYRYLSRLAQERRTSSEVEDEENSSQGEESGEG